MPKQAFPAAAEGMPNFNRRTFLRGVGSAGIAASVVSASTVAAGASAADVAENPELIRLGQDFPVIEAEYRDAVDTEFRIVAEWSPRWPRCPEILHAGWHGWGGPIERNMTGWGIQHVTPSGERRSRNIHTATELQSYFEMAERSVRRAKTEKSRASAIRSRNQFATKLAAARKYESECARIHDVSGYKATHERLLAAEKRLIEHVTAVLREQPETIAGIVIQARALDAASELSAPCRAAAEATSRTNWSGLLAASIMRIAA